MKIKAEKEIEKNLKSNSSPDKKSDMAFKLFPPGTGKSDSKISKTRRQSLLDTNDALKKDINIMNYSLNLSGIDERSDFYEPGNSMNMKEHHLSY